MSSMHIGLTALIMLIVAVIHLTPVMRRFGPVWGPGVIIAVLLLGLVELLLAALLYEMAPTQTSWSWLVNASSLALALSGCLLIAVASFKFAVLRTLVRAGRYRTEDEEE